MSDLALGRRGGFTGDTFQLRTVILLLTVGITGFVGMLVLGAFAPDLRSGRNGGAHALSNPAVGYSGIVQLASATGRNPVIIRNDHQFGSEDLLVATPVSGSQNVGPVLSPRSAKPTLLVMPKWVATGDREHKGWVRIMGLVEPDDPGSLMAPHTLFKIRQVRSGSRPLHSTSAFDRHISFRAPAVLQVIASQVPAKGAKALRLVPLLTDEQGQVVLARYGDGPLYILADPDLLSNAGIKAPDQAAAALAMLDWLNSTGATSIGFDVTLNGLGHSQSPLRLAFTPPFLAMTLALAAVLLLVGWHALGRFGPIQPRMRAIGLGKAVLVENSAKLVRRARRESRLGKHYAQVIRERAVATFGVPARLKGAALDAYLDRLAGRGGRRFTELVRAVEASRDRASLTASAHALYEWQKETKG